ncbi:hypothetical protein PIB30_092570 [Stylosanthes scabra]|uniref:Uncharacterized protein n=1 Tax=Stylosanthes scabra TaxID=79078 RepID=A0ABU6UUD6_9FABA|nr:hypothetical protein [Stylosanthes scabra]
MLGLVPGSRRVTGKQPTHGKRGHILRDREMREVRGLRRESRFGLGYCEDAVRFDPDRPYELPIESLFALRCRDPSRGKDPSTQRSGPSKRASLTPQYSPLSPMSRLGSPPSLSKKISLTQGLEGERPLKNGELIVPSEGWMCDGDELEGKEVSGGISARVDEAKGIEEEDKNEEEEEEEEEDPEEDPSEEEMPTAPCAMDVDDDEDYLQ